MVPELAMHHMWSHGVADLNKMETDMEQETTLEKLFSLS